MPRLCHETARDFSKIWSPSVQRIGVIGAGAWGTALALTARRAGRDVTLWAREPEVVDSITRERRNTLFLPDVPLDDGLRVSADMAAVAQADAVLLVPPAQHLRATCAALKPHLAANTPVVICAKGIEQDTCALMTEIVAEVLPGHVALVLSGPTFAKDVALGLPTAVTLATGVPDVGRAIAGALKTKTFRPYVSADPVGVEVGGAAKNVLAIGCGISDGKGLGANARAALLTRGLAEIVRLAVACGGRPETLMGLAGLGDLVLTATSMQSRNYSLGVALGQGKTLDEILGARRAVTEGVTTAAAVVKLAGSKNVEMPICAAMNRVLNAGASVDGELRALLDRPLRDEVDAR
ncbi:MAG: NAD(P)H-dependent glycerol-3-phosphate dehydrogenase [Rhodospirillaceae bacterium]|nr:NAD(P)H-dependent glycerol-3-phosphate dehydrogenase [Rhodospirillaceae bacterium]